MKVLVTKIGLEKMKDDLLTMRTVDMKRIMNALAEAREKGDISESAEYEMAREDLNMLNLKIETLQNKINNCEVVSKTISEDGTVQIFSKVKLLNSKTKKEIQYEIVSEDEIDIKSGKISLNSPIGKALLGKTKGEKVSVVVPVGTIDFKILNVE